MDSDINSLDYSDSDSDGENDEESKRMARKALGSMPKESNIVVSFEDMIEKVEDGLDNILENCADTVTHLAEKIEQSLIKLKTKSPVSPSSIVQRVKREFLEEKSRVFGKQENEVEVRNENGEKL